MVNKELLSPCGVYCGVCSILIAYRDNNQKFKERLAPVFQCTPEEIECEGCLSDKVFGYCRVCSIKSCVLTKGYEGCHQCSDWPCDLVHNIPLPIGKKVVMRSIPRWRELGSEKWAEEEERRYTCPECGGKLFRGARRCHQCGISVDVD